MSSHKLFRWQLLPSVLPLVLALTVPAAFSRTSVPEVAGSMPEDRLPVLKEILRKSLTQSPSMLMQNIYLAQSAANRYLSDSPLWPNLGGSLGYGENGARSTSQPPSTSKTTGLSYGINLSQPLFQWGALKAGSDIGKLSQQVAERQFADAFRGLASALRSQYLGLISRKILIRNRRFEIKLMESAFAGQEEQAKAGTISAADLNTPQLNLEEARLNLEVNGQEYQYAKQVFLRLAGLEQLPEESIPSEFPVPVFHAELAQALLAEFLAGGIDEKMQSQIYVLSLKQSDLNYKVANTSLYYPKFSFAAQYNLSTNTSFAASGPSTTSGITYGASINAYVPLFNGFTTKGQKLAILAAKRAVTQQQRNYLDETADSAQNLRRQLDFLARALDLAERRRALAEDGVKKVTEQFQEGTISKDTLEAVTANFNAIDYAAASARAEFMSKWTDFVSLVEADPILSVIPARYTNLHHGK